MKSCIDCRQTIALLNNVVYILKPATPEVPPAFSERIARKAFEQGRSWDMMVISWLRPASAWVALAFCTILMSLVWLSPLTVQPVDVDSEYEILSSMSTTTTQVQTQDFATWLDEGVAR